MKPKSILKITVRGNPVPKGRPRLGRGGRVFTPQRTKDYEQLVKDAARIARAMPHAFHAIVYIDFYRDSVRSCDIDNLVKAVMDGLNGLAWADDAQVVKLVATKGVDREDPRAEVVVEYYQESPPVSAYGG